MNLKCELPLPYAYVRGSVQSGLKASESYHLVRSPYALSFSLEGRRNKDSH